MNDNNELVGKILELGYDIDSRNEFFVTPLMIATRFGSNECIKVLLKHNADINKTDTFGWTALQFTTNENTKDLLIKNGAKISNNCIEKKYTVNHDNDFTFIEFL